LHKGIWFRVEDLSLFDLDYGRVWRSLQGRPRPILHGAVDVPEAGPDVVVGVLDGGVVVEVAGVVADVDVLVEAGLVVTVCVLVTVRVLVDPDVLVDTL
jgi:hypothetical protein